MYSKIKLFGNPVHPILVAHPTAFSIGNFVACLVYPRAGNPYRFRAGDPVGRARPRRGGIPGLDADPERRGRHEHGLSPVWRYAPVLARSLAAAEPAGANLIRRTDKAFVSYRTSITARRRRRRRPV
jgi:hypothetical protein